MSVIQPKLISQIKDLFEHSEQCVFIKDKHLNYCYMNKKGLDTLFLTEENILGKQDKEMHVSKYANDYNEHDLAAMDNHIYHQLDWAATLHGEMLFALSEKLPLKDENGEVQGVFALFCLIKPDELMNSVDLKRHLKNAAFKTKVQKRDLIKSYFNLSAREMDILFYYLQGMSAKKVADSTHISSKTVEFHLSNIKKKWNCHNKDGLFSAAYEKGYLQLSFLWTLL